MLEMGRHACGLVIVEKHNSVKVHELFSLCTSPKRKDAPNLTGIRFFLVLIKEHVLGYFLSPLKT